MYTTHGIDFRWQPLEKAAFGLIYGAIMVLSLLLALGDPPESPFEPALILFGLVFAVTLARPSQNFCPMGSKRVNAF